MQYNKPRSAAAVWRGIGIAVIVGAILYAFSPIRNQLGSVDPVEKRVAVGALHAKQLNGNPWSLADHRGQVVLVNFWATWCPPCRAETPSLVEMHNKFKDRGFAVVGITMDEEPESVVPDFVRSYSIPYPIVVPDSESALLNEVEALPTSLLIDRQGRVARKYQGIVTEIGLRNDVAALLAEESL